MNITSTPSYVPPFAGTQSVQSSQVTGASDPDGDGDGGGRVHKSHSHGGHMHGALMQALQSLGLSMPQTANATTSSNQTSGSSDRDGDSDGSTSATSGVKNDMRQFMHALFQAVRGESAAGTSTTATNSSDPKASFAAGLTALITQVSSGSAPSDLQGAFSKLVSDLQQTTPTSSDTGSTSANTGTTTPEATLRALLTQVQQNLGYGNSSVAATGNVISTQV